MAEPQLQIRGLLTVDAAAFAAVAVSYENRPNSFASMTTPLRASHSTGSRKWCVLLCAQLAVPSHQHCAQTYSLRLVVVHGPRTIPVLSMAIRQRLRQELTAVSSELATVPRAWRSVEPRENAIRMLDHVPARARNPGEVLELSATAMVGEYFTFQAGVFANGPALRNVSVSFSSLEGANVADSGSDDNKFVIPTSAMTCFNLGGNDQHGLPFTKDFSVGAGQVGALWFGIDLPSDMSSVGTFKGTITLSAISERMEAVGASHTKTLHLTLTIKAPPNGKPLPLHGDEDVYSMRRLRWLDSTIGVDDEVTHPFTNLTARSTSNGISIGVINKVTHIGLDSPITVSRHYSQASPRQESSATFQVLGQPVARSAWSAGNQCR